MRATVRMGCNAPSWLSGFGYTKSNDVVLTGDFASGNARVESVSSACQVVSLALLLLGVAVPTLGQNQGPDLVRVSSSVHALIDPIAGANSAVILNDMVTIVVDAQLTPVLARYLSDLIPETEAPVRYVVNTHWHVDHSHGNATFRELYPDIEIVSHPTTVDAVVERGPRQYGLWPDFLEQQDSPSPLFPSVLDDLEEYRPLGATITVSGEMGIRRPDLEVIIIHPGRGHTEGDLVVFVPSDSVLISGDLLLGFAEFPLDYAQTLRNVLGASVHECCTGARSSGTGCPRAHCGNGRRG